MVHVWFCLLNHRIIQQHRLKGASKDHLVQFLAESQIAPLDICRPVILILIVNTSIDWFLTTTCWKDWVCSLGQHWGSFTVTESQNGDFPQEPDPAGVGSIVQDCIAAHSHATINLKPSLGQFCAPGDKL